MRALLVIPFVLAACTGDDGPAAERPRLFGGAREVELQVPTDFDGARTYPLLMILHGYGASALLQQGYFKLATVADTDQMLVLAPEGTTDAGGKQFWNSGPECCGGGVDDVAYLGGLLDEVAATWPVDPSAVMVLGHSNGAFMAYRLACERADRITAIAGLAGHATSSATACAPTRAVSVLHVHGTADDTVPYETGTFGGVPSPGAVDSVAAWSTRNRCTGAPTAAGRQDLEASLDGAETAVMTTAGCPTGGATELWTMDGAGHIPAIGPAFPTSVLAWFAAHRR